MKKLGLVALAFLLTACGSATSESTDDSQTVATSIPKIERSVNPTTGSVAPRQTAPQVQDGEASEVSSVPVPQDKRTDGEVDYLAQLDEQGITTQGMEDQLIGAGQQACRAGKDSYIIPAVGGQLVEQKKTDLTPEEASDVIRAAASDHLC
ncbi:DUF732 domain-containing protein [Corynebacterium glucuronolyticum]|uniref:DUF732 domain-containing protein n=1 Tax=Corynebacterium glucuronolyticum TaxID=39791 RepID=UPI00223A8E87|nr:DUF732 domain-containing protein [Corynebacterium glucuronolyticum]MCT1442923.1 DUF732 domain-containing protein [Corynebacterium glucuronolyticum]